MAGRSRGVLHFLLEFRRKGRGEWVKMLREQAGIVRELASNPAYSDIREELLVLAGRREQEALLVVILG
jgi:hypothetical protein